MMKPPEIGDTILVHVPESNKEYSPALVTSVASLTGRIRAHVFMNNGGTMFVTHVLHKSEISGEDDSFHYIHLPEYYKYTDSD